MSVRNSNQKKDKRIIVRLSEDDYNIITDKANTAKMTLSDYIRITALSSKRGKTPKIEENVHTNLCAIVCTACKSENPLNAHFCRDCGTKLAQIEKKVENNSNWKNF